MLKLMKYEFRKLRMVLLIMLIALVVLEIGFVAGYHFEKPDVFGVCIALITILTFAVYGYILVSGVAGYYRELSNRTGYMIFMTPRRSIEIVLSKILFTLLAAIAATLVFGAAAYLDYRFLVNGLNVDASVIKQANMALRMAFGNFQLSLDQLAVSAVYLALTTLIGIALWMCTAFLSATLAATLLQNKKGFWRGLVSVALFFLLAWAAGWLNDRLLLSAGYPFESFAQVSRSILASLAFNLALAGVFACASAWLLDRKVSL